MNTAEPDTDWHSARWLKLRDLFDHIQALGPARQQQELTRLARDDPGMAEALRSLLAAHRDHARHTDRDRQRLLGSALRILQAPPLQAGDQLGPYRLERELGRGGMGVVYLARRAVGRAEQQVAIKVMAGHIDSSTRRRFRREQEILATLEHPNIAHFLDAGETAGGAPYVVMEYVAGVPLTSYCDALALSVQQRLRLFLMICEAVAYAHAKLILHRDIKPGNILVTPDGNIKLIDFGIATPLHARLDATRTRQHFFSPVNAAPEQLRGERPTIACDVYQLGTLLYELLCGRPIFELQALTPAELEAHIRERPPEPPSVVAARGRPGAARVRAAHSPAALATRLRGDLDNIALHALRKAPRERYASVERLAEDVGNYLARRPVRARRGHGLYRARKFISRNRLGASSAGLVMAVVSALLLVLYLQAQRLQVERDLARQDQARADITAGFLADIFRTADPGISLVRDMRISEVLGNAEERLRGSGAVASTSTRVQLLHVLADVRLKRGEYAVARELLDEGEALLITAPPGRERDLLQLGLIETRARLSGSMGFTRRAHDLAGQALDLHARLGHSAAESASAHHTRVRALAEFAAPRVALQAYEDLYAGMRADPESDALRLARVEVQLAQLLMHQYTYPRAGQLIHTAVQRMSGQLPEGHPDLLWILGARANYLDQAERRGEEALRQLEALYHRQTELFGDHSVAAATTRLWMAHARHRLDQPHAALSEVQRAHRMYATAHEGPSTDLVRTLTLQARLYLELDQLAQAAATYRGAVAMARVLWGDDTYRVAELNGHLAVVLARLGREEEARRLLNAAITADPVPTPDNLELYIALAEIEARHRPRDALDRLELIRPILTRHTEHLPPALLHHARSVQAMAEDHLAPRPPG